MNKKRSLLIIFLTILTDLIGFGMIIPLSPLLARDFGADGLQVGLLISMYSLTQFMFAPFWGRLSDSLGRKPVLLFGLLGMAFAHIWFAFSTTLIQLFLSRILAGFFGGNVVTATAYISDITDTKNRTKNLGLIGAAFGLGFTIGPVLGGLFLFIGESLGSAPPFGASFASIAAGFLSLLNFIATFIFLKESRLVRAPIKKLSFSRPPFSFIWKSLKQPVIGKIFFISFILWFALAQIEPTLILFVRDEFAWTQRSAYWGFAYIGLLMAITQGIFVRRWISRFGERKVNTYGLALASLGLTLMAASLLSDKILFSFLEYKATVGIIILTIAVTFFSVGHSLASTSISGALSLLSSKQKQGQMFGIHQSLSALARILGPICGGWMYRDFSHGSPFVTSGVLSFGAFFIAFRMGKSFPNPGQIKFFKKKNSFGKKSIFDSRDSSLYSLDKSQLLNLIQKRVGFHLIPLEDFKEERAETMLVRDKEGKESLFLSHLFNKLNIPAVTLHNITLAEKVSENSKSSFSFLKSLPTSQALIFICEEGKLSEDFSKKVREQGYFNAYYLEEGWKTLSQ